MKGKVAVEEGDNAIDGYFLFKASAHEVVTAVDGGLSVLASEAYRAVVGVVGDVPDAGGGLDEGLVAVQGRVGGGRGQIVLFDVTKVN